MRRIVTTTVLLLTLVLAVPASAATWRTLGTATGQGHAGEGQHSFNSLYVGARGVSDIQVGFKVYGNTKRVAYDYSVWCWNNGNEATKSRTGLSRAVAPGGWRWVTVWSRSRRNACDISVSSVLSDYGAGMVKTRVRMR